MGRKKLTNGEFITKARMVHGDRYNYDKVVYVGSNKKITIICPMHGEFDMIANNHTSNKNGCPVCAKETRSKATAKALTMSKEEFIERAKEKNEDKYDYSLVEINGNNKAKVKIKCNTCGCIFEQNINNHLRGQGCPECKKEKIAMKLRISLSKFLEKARKIHGSKYDYSLVDNIKNRKTKIKIKCNVCGLIFEQRVEHHLHGCGCPHCKSSHLESQTRILLEKCNIKYETEKTFPWLKNKREMPLDFYLPDYNVAIECQGPQHYLTEGNGFFTDEAVNGIQERDKLKYRLCEEHGIPIHYISYDEDVEKRLNEILKSVA